MHLASGRDLGHLTYCTNIHAGEPLDEVMASLARHLPDIKKRVAPKQPLGVGLRLGNAAASSLREPAKMAQLRACSPRAATTSSPSTASPTARSTAAR